MEQWNLKTEIYGKEVTVALGGWVAQLPYRTAKKLFPLKTKAKTWSIPLPENWQEIRQEVINRDGVCQICGGEGSGIHHIDHDRRNNNLVNLVYLCWPCHRSIHNLTATLPIMGSTRG